MSKSIVKDFLKKVKDQKIEQMLGIALDKKYWATVIGSNDVEELRKELGLEKEKIIKNRNGTIHQDNRDMDKIASLEREINTLEKAVVELVRLNEMEKGIKLYVNFIDNPSKDAIEELENVAKM